MSHPGPAAPVASHGDSLDLLEFPRIAGHLAGLTRTAAGRGLALGLEPLNDRAAITTALNEAVEAIRLLGEKGPLPVGDGDDLLPLLDAAAIEGRRLPVEAFAPIRGAAEAAAACRAALAGSAWPLLGAHAASLVPLPQLVDAIRRSIGPRGELLDGASSELGRLRREAREVRARIKRQLDALLLDERYAGIFQDELITDRNGRYVVPVRTDHAGRLRGFVHDVSASGQTLFVEPAATLDGNNRLQTLLREGQREEERILLQLTAMVRVAAAELAGNQAILAHLDLRLAIARFAVESDAAIPLLTEAPLLELAAARHPLLVMKLGAAAVPIDLRLGPDDRVLVVSGPNTGGKTAALKTAGLLVLMARAGLPIPCAPGSRLFPFTPVLADIGDEQSLERSLSTFSGHLGRVRDILAAAGPQTLALLDELGTGTDPAEGGALALAVLDQLRRSGARVIATTHLNLIKGYAHLEDGVVNAAVEFDAETLRPIFRLHYGIPGASHAFTIARRLGLPAELLARADHYLGHGEREGLSVLERLQALRASLDEELQAAGALRRQAEREQEQQRRLREDLEARQRTILEDVRQRGSRLLSEAEEQLRTLFRDARQGPLPPAREQARLTGELRALRGRLPRPQAVPPGVVPSRVAVNELLFVTALGVDARVVGSDGATVELELGGKRLRQPLAALRQYQPPRLAPPPAKGAKVRDRVTRRAFRPRLVLVGKRVDKALDLTAAFLDDGLLHGEMRLEIVHGAGEGVLRRAIREFLAGRSDVAGFGPADVGEGGDNVTVVELAGR
ncbi:MAG: endonuclease MutS2 [Deltaproteobacteria bacterium]|nr:MAG: endonuclease MutS2 [Deltaproteobacteria bacterium]